MSYRTSSSDPAPKMRTCPVCRSVMEPRPSFGVEIDVCTQCAAVFLDPGEAEAYGVDTGALFGATGPGAAIDLGPSARPCPAHRVAMTRFRIQGARGPVDIERASCCGGVFLDPGEQGELARAAAHAARLAHRVLAPAPQPLEAAGEVRTATGAVFALPPEAADPKKGGALGALVRGVMATAAPATGRSAPGGRSSAPPAPPAPAELAPSEATERRCPRCGGPYAADRTGGVEIDVCAGCGSLFFDPGELEARGVDTAALFGVGPEAAVSYGPSPLRCPAHDGAMEIIRITTFAGVLEIDRASCCGGIFLDGGEQDALSRAAQASTWAAADRQFERDGEVVGEAAITKAVAAGSNINAATADFVRGRVDSMIVHMLRRRQRRHHGIF